MPMYEYQCPECHKVEEHYVSLTDVETVFPCACLRDKLSLMRRVVSVPGLIKVGGVAGKLRQGEQLRRRNDAYFKSSHGQEEHRANVAAAHKRLGV